MDCNDLYRLRLATVLQYMERALGQLETTLTSSGSPHILRSIEDDLTPWQKERISGCVHVIRSFIVSLKSSLSLEVHTLLLSRMVKGIATTLWVTLEEIQPEQLNHYSRVPDEIKTMLDPALDGMMRQIQELQNLVAKR